MRLCKHCRRPIVLDDTDGWVDPDADGDDEIWRVVCDAHDTFVADHEPQRTREEILDAIVAIYRANTDGDGWDINIMSEVAQLLIDEGAVERGDPIVA